MSIKSYPNVKVRTFEVQDGSLHMSLVMTCKYNPLVHSPKVTLIAEYEGKTRFLPVLVQSYFQNVDLETCTIVAEYTYDINSLFIFPVKDSPVEFFISLLYGDDYTEKCNLTVDGDIRSDEQFCALSSCNDKNGLFIKRKAPYSKPHKNPVLRALRWLISNVYYLFVRLFGLILVPFLILDAFMAYFGLKEGGYVSSETRTPLRFFVDYLRVGFKAITREEIGRKDLKEKLAVFLSNRYKKEPVVQNRVTFISNRRSDLNGNLEDIYNVLKDNKDVEIQMLFDDHPMHRMSMKNIAKFAKLYATSAVVIIDDFYELTSIVPKKDEVKLVQVWHACGAFKTFGFSRLGKPGGPRQTCINHRMYDRAIVSSDEIRRFYAEGFGIPIANVIATGVPRTDMFFSEEIKLSKQNEFYEKYPSLRDKKIILFAPTFRGNGRLTGNYPMEKFDLESVYEAIGDEYAILVKMHPFVNNPVIIPEKYKASIIDFSADSELNDLLFVTDILITDYSSVVFEASLLGIPMLFYAFDLSEYIATRDFYYEYASFLPGKLELSLDGVIKAINSGDFESEKIEAFRNRFFDERDGKSSQRVADMILGLLK